MDIKNVCTPWLLCIVFVLIVASAGFLAFLPKAKAPITKNSPIATTTSATLEDFIVVSSPLPNTLVGSTTLTVSGRARGSWYFEASAPIRLENENHTVIAYGNITAQGDWMTTDFVPFSATLAFHTQLPGSLGTLILTNDNPSDDPAKEKTLKIPVRF